MNWEHVFLLLEIEEKTRGHGMALKALHDAAWDELLKLNEDVMRPGDRQQNLALEPLERASPPVGEQRPILEKFQTPPEVERAPPPPAPSTESFKPPERKL